MKTSRAKTGKKRVAKKKGSARGTRAPVDLTAIRQQITNQVGSQAVRMVELTIDEVDKGHYAAMKYLFEMIGLYPIAVQEEAPGENTLAKTLLRRLGLPEEAAAVTEVTPEGAIEQLVGPAES